MIAARRANAIRSAELAWYCVTAGTVVLIGALLLFGPHSAISSAGTPYNPFPELFRRLLQGLQLTGEIVLFALLGSTIWGVMIGVGRVSSFRPVSLLASLYVEVIRGIPLLVILFMIYYGLNQFLPPHHKIGSFAAAVLGLGICYGAFMGEVVRAGIEAIPFEEIEAASLEAGRWEVLRYVILPRALRTILPAGANECIALLKDSSLVSILAIDELAHTGQQYASSKFLFFESYSMVALIYLILTLVLSRAVRSLEQSWA